MLKGGRTPRSERKWFREKRDTPTARAEWLDGRGEDLPRRACPARFLAPEEKPQSAFSSLLSDSGKTATEGRTSGILAGRQKP